MELGVVKYLLLISVVGFCFSCKNPGPNDPLPPGGLVWVNCTRPNEYYSCGSACQTECATLGEPCPIVNIRCNDACYCCPEFAKDTEYNCIPKEQCPPTRKCGKN